MTRCCVKFYSRIVFLNAEYGVVLDFNYFLEFQIRAIRSLDLPLARLNVRKIVGLGDNFSMYGSDPGIIFSNLDRAR